MADSQEDKTDHGGSTVDEEAQKSRGVQAAEK